MWKLFKKKKRDVFDKALLNQLYRYAYSLSNEESLAFDLVQMSCEKTLRLDDPNKQTKPYMMTIIRHAFIDQYRRKHFELVVDTNELTEVIEDEARALKSLEDLQIEKENVALILAEVSPQERELLFLWAVEGLTIQEIASLTETPIGTLLSRLSRLRKRLIAKFGHLNEQVSL
ncbi:RNA polymerase subunit sigma-24 [Enterovibrio coralii]|uniref:RNA polymerase subunit sigma-24 n=2 Tax=Enterovibrio coralii TaxID=294935 RepID=A0A135IDA2_9GAMM|nr:RNA polymerase subunit sigma-24 [Enterovibrio coralii]